MPTDTEKDFVRSKWKAGTLAPHIDGGSFADALAGCLKYAHHATFDAWGDEFGEQILAHIQVGLTGHTCTFWNLTPWRYAIVLCVMRQKIPPTKWACSGGPQFYKFNMVELAEQANTVMHQVRSLATPDERLGVTRAVLEQLPVELHREPEGQANIPDLTPGPMVDMSDPPLSGTTTGVPPSILTAPTVVSWKTMVIHWVSATGPTPRYSKNPPNPTLLPERSAT